MAGIQHYIKNIASRLTGKSELTMMDALIPVGVLILFLINASYVQYPDEFVNVLGGKYILNGRLPYRDFFDHHLPLAWYLSAVFLIFSFGKFLLFRYIWALFTFVLLLWTGSYIHKTHKSLGKAFDIFFIMYPLISVYYWLHLYLADSLAFLFFSVSFWIILAQTYTKKPTFRGLVYASIGIWALVFSSLTYAYLALFLYAWIGYLAFKNWGWKSFLKITGLSVAPYALYGVYLFATGTFDDFWMANITYNTELYISLPNHTRGAGFNPFKFILTLVFNFLQNYLPQLAEVTKLPVYFPVNMLTAWASFLFMLLLFHQNKILGLIFFFVLALSAPRSNVREIGETNYQISVYLALGFISTYVALWRMKVITFADEHVELFKKISGTALITFFVFSALFLAKNVYDKWYQRYVQIFPSIVEERDVKRFADELIPPTEKYWAGPFEPDENFYIPMSQTVGKFPTLLPQFREDERFLTAFMQQFKETEPALIIYKNDASVFNTPALEFGAFFVDWMTPRYTRIPEAGAYEILRSPTAFTIQSDVYIRNDILDQTLQKLEDLGYIRKEEP